MGGSQLLASGHLFSMSSICFDTCLCGSTGPQKFSHDDRVFILSQQFLSIRIILSEHTREKRAKKGQRNRPCCRKEKKEKTTIEYVSIQHFCASEIAWQLVFSRGRGGIPFSPAIFMSFVSPILLSLLSDVSSVYCLLFLPCFA
jgi:hypothetical protein